ncbi:MAG: FkbM family methyltransferase [Crocinitomicaceae bacterium]|nr:FkbM family methyltransferase [Flavobacteriales bacterium]NQZ37290.1 FkbM family methyltransferase [Crocinitomicaceae bacterium]
MKALIFKALLGIYKVLPGKRIICKTLKAVGIPNTKFYRDLKFSGSFKVQIDDDQHFLLNHYGGTIENETFWKGLFKTWESDTGWIWMELCGFSTSILDIGANTGIYSMVAKTINQKAKVYAFEPSNHTFKKLVANNEKNKFDISCEQIALSNFSGKQTFFDVPDSNQTSASLSPEKLKNWDEYTGEICEYEVETMKISDYIERNGIEHLDLIKMDIEMHEPEAIEGLGEYLLKFKPIVVIEVISEKVAADLNALIDLNEHVIFHLKGANHVQKVNEFSYIPPLWNFIFFHKDQVEKMKKYTSLYSSK